MRLSSKHKKENKGQIAVNAFLSHQTNSTKQSPGFADNRSESIFLRELQQAVNKQSQEAEVAQRIEKEELFEIIGKLKTEENYIAILELIRNEYKIGDDSYDLKVITSLDEIPADKDYVPPPIGAMGATAPVDKHHNKVTVYIDQAFLINSIESPDSIGNLVSTMRHEYTHVKQNQGGKLLSGLPLSHSGMEYEAYASEIEEALDILQHGDKDSPPMANKHHLTIAYTNLQAEFEKLSHEEQQNIGGQYKYLDMMRDELLPNEAKYHQLGNGGPGGLFDSDEEDEEDDIKGPSQSTPPKKDDDDQWGPYQSAPPKQDDDDQWGPYQSAPPKQDDNDG